MAITVVGLCYNVYIPILSDVQTFVELDRNLTICDIKESAYFVFAVFNAIDVVVSFAVPVLVILPLNISICIRLMKESSIRSQLGSYNNCSSVRGRLPSHCDSVDRTSKPVPKVKICFHFFRFIFAHF